MGQQKLMYIHAYIRTTLRHICAQWRIFGCFQNIWENCGNFNGFFHYVLRALKTSRSCSRGQFYIFKPEWPKESINGFKTINCRPYRLGVFSNYCLYIQHTYNFVAYLRKIEHFWLFSKTLGQLREFQWLSSQNRKRVYHLSKSSMGK